MNFAGQSNPDDRRGTGEQMSGNANIVVTQSAYLARRNDQFRCLPRALLVECF